MAVSSSVSGLISGLDWNNVIDQLMAIERRPINILDARQTEYESKLSAWQEVNTKLLALKTEADSLNSINTIHAMTASSDNEEIVTATASGSASAGIYSIEVTALAKAHKVSSDSYTDTTTALGYSGDILINGKVVTLVSDDSLSNIKGRINSANAGVTATILDVSSTDHRLVLTSDETGAANSIDLIDANTSDILQGLGFLTASVSTQDYSDQFTSSTTAVGTLLSLTSPQSGTVQVNGVDVAIDLAVDSLTDIKDRINNTPGIGTTASITSSTVDGTTMYKIELTGTNTYTDSNNMLETLGFVNGVVKNERQAAQNASLKVDGISITRSTNTISDVIEGLTLNLKKAEAGTTVNISVSNDVNAVKAAIEDFVNVYNDVVSYINEQFSYNSEATDRPLMGDFTVRSIQSDLRNIITSQVSGLTGSITALSQIGITTNTSDATLTIDDSELTDALTDNLDDVEELFRAAGGVADQLVTKLDYLTDPYSGLVPSRQEGVQDTIDDLQKQMDAMEVRMTMREEKLRERFTAMEMALAQMQAQNTWLAQQILSLSSTWSFVS